ncbi:MAG: MFS transporter [Gammaproteobacteria bacterium]|tara:strand:+ start:2884 stop:4083 length:1200 start_codon:yes stop_codon:yes gene_type:complete
MSAAELKTALSLALVFFLRMLPLFMILPILSLANDDYIYSTPQLLGLALGIYGLTQAVFQIPFGMLSDRWGRKPIIVLGLIIFGLGSLIAAMADSIYGLLIGRAMQGAGAVAAAIMALAADLTKEESRTKVMAFIGISIGAAFSIAFIAGPILYTYIGIDGLFYLGVCFSVLAIIALLTIVPNPTIKIEKINELNTQKIKAVFSNPALIKLNISIFSSHLILMANFVAIPVSLKESMQIIPAIHWQIYLKVIFLSLFIMVPFIFFGERLKKEKLFLICSILLIACSQIGLALFDFNLNIMIVFLILFFGAFNYLEALLPSMVSKTTYENTKGTALGVYSTSQFIGIFIGGLVGGFFMQHHGLASVHLLCLLITFIWLCLTIILSKIEQLSKNELEEKAV